MKGPVPGPEISPRLFKNPVLEWFSHIHPLTPLVYVPVILWSGAKGFALVSLFSFVTLWIVGVLLWTLTEYTLHRFLFHFEVSENSTRAARAMFLLHGVHHDYPRDKTRLVLPFSVTLPLAFLFYFIFKNIFATGAWSVFSGYLFGYICYDLIHYAVHHYSWRFPIFNFLRAYHLKHHFSGEDAGYGVSCPLWDVLFRTSPSK